MAEMEQKMYALNSRAEAKIAALEQKVAELHTGLGRVASQASAQERRGEVRVVLNVTQLEEQLGFPPAEADIGACITACAHGDKVLQGCIRGSTQRPWGGALHLVAVTTDSKLAQAALVTAWTSMWPSSSNSKTAWAWTPSFDTQMRNATRELLWQILNARQPEQAAAPLSNLMFGMWHGEPVVALVGDALAAQWSRYPLVEHVPGAVLFELGLRGVTAANIARLAGQAMANTRMQIPGGPSAAWEPGPVWGQQRQRQQQHNSSNTRPAQQQRQQGGPSRGTPPGYHPLPRHLRPGPPSPRAQQQQQQQQQPAPPAGGMQPGMHPPPYQQLFHPSQQLAGLHPPPDMHQQQQLQLTPAMYQMLQQMMAGMQPPYPPGGLQLQMQPPQLAHSPPHNQPPAHQGAPFPSPQQQLLLQLPQGAPPPSTHHNRAGRARLPTQRRSGQ